MVDFNLDNIIVKNVDPIQVFLQLYQLFIGKKIADVVICDIEGKSDDDIIKTIVAIKWGLQNLKECISSLILCFDDNDFSQKVHRIILSYFTTSNIQIVVIGNE
jgi:hypothetical protein